MSPMERKQIYIEQRQAARLQRVAQALGLSEAALIRQAIDQFLATGAKALPAQPGAWAQAVAVMRALQAQGPLPNRRRTWTRANLYADDADQPGHRVE